MEKTNPLDYSKLSKKELSKIAKSDKDISIPNSQLSQLPKVNLLNLLNGV